MRAVKAAAWFVRNSWFYLGCDRGTGRWKMRRKYFWEIVPKMVWFVKQGRRDHHDQSHTVAA